MASPTEQGTVKPAPGFDAEKDSEALRKAMKGLGTNEKALTDIIAYRSNAQRQEIKLKYKTLYGRDLVDDLKSELSGDFEKVLLGLMMTPARFDAHELKCAIKGAGTDEAALIEILCTRTPDEIKAIKEEYKKHFKKNLEKDVASDTSGDFKRILISMVAGGRDPEGTVDCEKAKRDAKELYEAGEARWGTDEAKFNMIIASRSFSHLRVVFEEYKVISKHDIADAIRKEMSGDVEQAYLAIVMCVRDRPSYFAERLYKSMKGLGTDERCLTRVMVSRSEVDMVQIKQRFNAAYGKTLESFIKGDTHGDYEKVLLALARD